MRLDGPVAGGRAPIKAGLAAVGGQTQLRVYDDGSDSTPRDDRRRNEFHTLQDEMHQKRAVGMRWGVRRETVRRARRVAILQRLPQYRERPYFGAG